MADSGLTDLIAAHWVAWEMDANGQMRACDRSLPYSTVREWATHVASMIAETHAVIELPKPANVNRGQSISGMWLDGIITAHFGKGKVRCYLEDPRMTSDDAREIGAGLIAAAVAADRIKEKES